MKGIPVESFDHFGHPGCSFIEDIVFMALMETAYVFPQWVHRKDHAWYYTWFDGSVYCLSLGENGEWDVVQLINSEAEEWTCRRLWFKTPEQAQEAFTKLPELLMEEVL